MTSRQSFRTAAFVVAVGIMATTLAQPAVLASLPIRNLLKNELVLDRTTSAAFLFWIGIAWYLKPFAGIVTDVFPLFGTRRRSYLLVGSVLATFGWDGGCGRRSLLIASATGIWSKGASRCHGRR